jgi:hypothetical protein
MATAQDYANWIVRNKDKKGTPEFDKVAQAYSLARQRDAAPQAAIAEPAVPETPQSRSWGQVAPEAARNLPRSMFDLAAGTAKGVYTLASGLADPKQLVLQAVNVFRNPGAIGDALRARYGSEDALKNTIATDPAGFLGDVSTLTGVGGLATGSRTLSRVSALTDPLRPAVNVLGTAGNMATNALSNVYVGGKARTLMQAAEGRGDEIINALRSQPEIVPGATPTAGQAAAPVGATRFSALQESAEKAAPSEYFARAQEQNAARVAAVQQVGQTPAALKAALQVREVEANLLYGTAGAKVVSGDATLDALRTRPSIQGAFERAERIAREDGYSLQGALQGDSWSNKSFTVADLHYMKLGMDDLISSSKQTGVGAVEQRKILSTRQQFLDWLENQAPEYKTARTAFAARSKPIDQMKVGQFLEGKLTSALQGEEALRAGSFATAVRDAPGTLKRATTGGARFEELSDMLTPAQVKAVNSVRDDLAREAKYKAQARAARPAGPDARTAGSELLIEVAGGAQLPTLLNRVTTVVNAILRRASGKMDEKIAMELALEMLDPKKTALALEAAQLRAARAARVTDPARAAGRALGRAATPIGATTNLLQSAAAQPPPENRNALRPQ